MVLSILLPKILSISYPLSLSMGIELEYTFIYIIYFSIAILYTMQMQSIRTFKC